MGTSLRFLSNILGRWTLCFYFPEVGAEVQAELLAHNYYDDAPRNWNLSFLALVLPVVITVIYMAQFTTEFTLVEG